MRFLFSMLLIFSLSCGQWRVSSLKSKEVTEIKTGEKPGELLLRNKGNDIMELSFTINIYGGKIYTVDNMLKRLQVFDRDGNVKLIIGSKKKGAPGEKDIIYSYFNFSEIGAMTVDSDDRIYVQNRFVVSKIRNSGSQGEDLDFSPSYILVFDNKGNLQYTVGSTGPPDIPFYYIENLFIDNDDRLFVVSRTLNSWNVSRFENKKRDFYIDLGRLDLDDTDGKEKFQAKIENIAIFQNGKAFLISAAYYNKFRFKYRKIFEYDMEKKKYKILINTPDPKNELFTVLDDKYIYLWDMKDKNVKFSISNYDGNIINNILFKFPEKISLYDNIFVDEKGQFYSYHINKESIKILEWK